MIPHVINDTSIMFIAKGRPWTLAMDHQFFDLIRDRLLNGCEDEDELAGLADVRVGISSATDGRAAMSVDGELTFDGETLDEAWVEQAMHDTGVLKVLVVSVGDKVRIAGDEDAPDGIYIVGAVDKGDAEKRIFVEDEEQIGFFGYVPNASIKEIVQRCN